jgi:NTP pyrophosphatase (non-canonical NTP hydrolase)
MLKSITLTEYQHQVDAWIKDIGKGYFKPTTNLCMLAEEVGEVSRLISRCYGEQKFKPNEEPADINKAIGDELADVLFIVGCLANDLKIDLNEAVERNFEKKNIRDKDRYKPD